MPSSNVGADSNATLGLQSKITKACISLDTKEYSYYAIINGKEIHGSHIEFSTDSFQDIMRKIG